MNRVVRGRSVVLAASGVALVFKVLLAFRTYGTSDVGRWQVFAAGVRSAGPVGVYGLNWSDLLYNHPPVIGYFLELVNGVGHWGIGVGAAIRVVASCADVISAVVVFELLRRRGPVPVAIVSGVLVGVSPVLFLVSGYHGNTDTIFTMLTILSLWLLADRDRPALAGAAMALALGVKIVPVVAVPALLVYAATRGKRTLVRFAAAGAVVFALFWGPALALQGKNVLAHVVFYTGSDLRQWGLPQIGHWFGDPAWATFMAGPGRFLVLVLCCAVPAIFVWRNPDLLAPVIGLSLSAFLLLSPAFGVQYAAWPAAASYLIGLTAATLYNLTAGIMLFVIYDRWSGGLPWTHAVTHASKFLDREVALGIVAWCALLVVVGTAIWKMTAERHRRPVTPTGAAARRSRGADTSRTPSGARSGGAARAAGAPRTAGNKARGRGQPMA